MKVAVVGGGIQGCTVALELARRGVAVTLFDRRERLFDGASRHSEGKVHLGFVYAGDPSLRTAGLMARGAAAFFPALRRWIGDGVERLTFSAPFFYAVHRGSLHPPDELASTYGRIAELLAEAFAGTAYVDGLDPSHVRRLTDGDAPAFGDDVAAAFETHEVAVDPDTLADALVAAVHEHDRIEAITGTAVARARRDGRLHVGDADGERTTEPFDHVVNCAWDGRLALDATVGITPPHAWSFRMKYFARVARNGGSEAPPTTTVVLGPFGDVVDFGDSTYLSWYPTGRRGWSGDVEPPAWPTTLSDADARDVTAGVRDGLAAIVPAASRLLDGDPAHVDVRGGVIYALGDTDVDDATSRLHTRHRVGPTSHATYHTVDTGKFTLAPLFALQVADAIAGDG